MVGIINEACVQYPVGSRVKIGDNCGTVKYIGEVCGHVGTWLGIEWDDPKRGKHNGSVDGRHYFRAQHPSAGSFIRPGKVGPFESLEEAVRNRYLGYTSKSLDVGLIRDTQQSLQASIFEVVGMDKIARKQSKFEQLTEVSVEGRPVNTAGYLKEFTRLTSLNLSDTLIWNWRAIASIVSQVPTMRNLNLSCNRILLPTEFEIYELEPVFRHLHHINLRRCGINYWSDVMQMARLWPSISSVSLQENEISQLEEVNCKEVFKNLRELDLHRTKVVDFNEICKLGNISTLTSLNLMENSIEQIKFHDCEPYSKINMFISLEQLNLSHNPIWNDSIVFNELDKLPKLKRLTQTPHFKSNFDEMFSKAVASISNLEVLNRREVSAEERRGAEYDIWKKHALEWLQACKSPEQLLDFYKKHRSYANIIKKYGSPAEFVPRTILKQSNLIKVRIQNQHTGETWERKVPRMISVQTLQGLIVKHFDLEQCTMPQLSYVDTKYPDLIVPLENGLKTLDFYSMQDDDIVLVKW